MGSFSVPEVQVTLNLDDGDDSLRARTLTFKASGGSLQVGRASKTEKKQLVPAHDNMWLSNPVISRNHALLSVEEGGMAKQPQVYIEDTGSSHGTFVNKRDIKAKGKTQLKTGDAVQFGDYVLRGTESFEPPIFKVHIKEVSSDSRPPLPQRATTGRSYSVPDESDEESEMDESQSEASSDESHSSPPHWAETNPADASTLPGSSMNNPFTIDDDFVESSKIVVEDAPSRETSEEYDPEDNVVGETYFEDLEPPSDDEGFEKDDRPMPGYNDEGELGPLQFMESPIYRPASPLRHIEPLTARAPTLPPYPGMTLNLEPTLYSQGPFAQPASYNTDMVSQTRFPDLFDVSSSRSHANFGAQSVADHIDETQTDPSIWAGPPSPRPQSPALKHTLLTTPSTQDFLDSANFAERTRANKKNMSITSLINPPAVAGSKRKAADISDDDEELEEDDIELQAEEEDIPPLLEVEDMEELSDDAVSATAGKGNKGVVVEVVEIETAVVPVPAVKTERPAKRRRTLASHLGSFALGGIAVFAGLVCLPDNYFG